MRLALSVVGGVAGFDLGAEFPEEPAQFPRDGDFDFVVMELAFSQRAEAVAQAHLGGPGEFFYPTSGAFLSGGELGADLGWDTVVGGLLNEDPAGVGIAAFADAALTFGGAAGVFGGYESEEGHELFGMLEAAEAADLRDGDHGGDELEAFEGHHGFNQWFALPVVEEMEHGGLNAFDALMMEVDGSEVVFEYHIVRGIGKGEMAQIAFVFLGPMGLARVVVAEAAEHGQKACFGTTQIINRIGPGAAEVADGFVDGVRDVDGDEVVGAEAFGQLHGVAVDQRLRAAPSGCHFIPVCLAPLGCRS